MNNRGLMIQCPCGTGKTYYINNMSKEDINKYKILDGDELLKSNNIKNRNYFWYNDNNKHERQTIINIFEQYLNNGYNIFYSGHPLLIKTDLLIIPNIETRWNRLLNRDDFKPTRQQFDKEQQLYVVCSKTIKTIFSDDIPSFESIIKS